MNIKEAIYKKEEVQKYCLGKEYLKALEEIDSVLSFSPLSTTFLLLKAQILQLLDNNYSNYGELEDIKEMLKNITLMDKLSVDAKLEFSYFLFNVENNKVDALTELNEAIEVCQKQLDDCIRLKKEIEEQG